MTWGGLVVDDDVLDPRFLVGTQEERVWFLAWRMGMYDMGGARWRTVRDRNSGNEGEKFRTSFARTPSTSVFSVKIALSMIKTTKARLDCNGVIGETGVSFTIKRRGFETERERGG